MCAVNKVKIINDYFSGTTLHVMDDIKVAVSLRAEKTSKKVWRFDPQRITDYTLHGVEQQLLQLFPGVKRKGLSLKLSYYDSFCGRYRAGERFRHAGISDMVTVYNEWHGKECL